MADLACHLPAWCDAHGLPKTWHHYVYGTAYLGRLRARESVREFGAFSAAQASKEDAMEWRDTMSDAARFLD